MERNRTLREQHGLGNGGVSRRRRLGGSSAFNNYLLRHAQTLIYALGQLSRRPFATLMTVAVIGIALAMPAGLHVMLKNVQSVLSGWDSAAQISLFLQKDATESSALALATQLEQRSEIASVDYISAEQAMSEFQRLSGFGDALKALEENPLPAVLVIHPALQQQGPEQLQRLVEELRGEAKVDLAQLDMQWVKRLYGLMDIGRRGVWVLASLLALAVLLVVGNTIRLAIQNRRDEIVITKLIGGTDAFIRRPFLYTGFWYGLLGGVIAFVMVEASLWVLAGPVNNLAGLYNSSFHLAGVDLGTAGALLLGGLSLGLCGSWLAVGRHLREIEPT
ncbi:MAG: permease-like cell division protein FtsX [Gammaproteobacteria bacterium]|nr:permease-like cell division protein FtsX [Gammaproteobacteria bacterium]